MNLVYYEDMDAEAVKRHSFVDECVFINKQRSVIHEHTTEWDVYTHADELVLMRTPLCRVVYRSPGGGKYILQLHQADRGTVAPKFVAWMDRWDACVGALLEGGATVEPSVRYSDEFRTHSICVECDVSECTFFHRDGTQATDSDIARGNLVVGVLYLDKVCARESANSDVAVRVMSRWRLLQLRLYAVAPVRECLIRYAGAPDAPPVGAPPVGASPVGAYCPVPVVVYCAGRVMPPPPPPPPPPLPPVFTGRVEIVLQKKKIIEKLKTEHKGFVVSQSELNTVLARFKKTRNVSGE